MNYFDYSALREKCLEATRAYFDKRIAREIDAIIASNKPLYEMAYKEEPSACMRLIYVNLPSTAYTITAIYNGLPQADYTTKLEEHIQYLTKALPTFDSTMIQRMAVTATNIEVSRVRKMAKQEIKDHFYHLCRCHVGKNLPRW